MSLLTHAFVVEKYGMRLNTTKLAEFLEITKPALYNQISARTCPVKTYVDGGSRWADAQHVAEYLSAIRETAT